MGYKLLTKAPLPFQDGCSFGIILINRAIDSSRLVEWKQGGNASVGANLRVQT